MEISMRDLFPRCANVLNRELRPIHYAELTELAMRELEIVNPDRDASGFRKNIENVREKLLLAGQRGTFYTGSPLFAGALRSWFVSEAQLAMTLDYIAIPGSAQAGVAGAFDALMRAPYMVTHNPNLAHSEWLNRVRSSGLVLEKHIAQWFKRQFPEFYGEASNHNEWTQPCSHDFTLTVNNRKFLIDIAGPDEQGRFGRCGRKHPTDIHLICRIDGDNCSWEGVVRGEGFRQTIDPESIFSPTAFIVWLNCHKHGIRYTDVAPTSRRHAA